MISLFRYGGITIVVLPRFPLIYQSVSIGLALIAGLGFLVASCKDPGYTENPNNLTLLKYYETYRSEFICVYCETRKPRHARHCHYCMRCVKVTFI
jgi:Uncharacterized protein containing DHHC-type Zn finger